MNDHHEKHLYEEAPLPEGEEKAPPMTRTMGILRWCILGAISLFALVMILSYFDMTPWSHSTQTATKYHCPMHPTYISNQPGDCPICGMSLVPIGQDESAEKSTMSGDLANMGKVSVAKPGQYYCPMDPEVASDTPGRCPLCKMQLEKFEPGMTFTCEMHPEVVTDHPGDCPKCGMDLIPRTAEASAGGMIMSDSSMMVPGLAPVVIDQQRLQLLSVRTGQAERRAISSTRHLTGYIVPDETRVRNLTVRISGSVRDLKINEVGQTVREGETLLTLYSQELYQAVQDYRLARSVGKDSLSSAVAKNNQQRIIRASRERLSQMGLSDQEITNIESDTTNATVFSLYAPFSGVVLAKNVLPGQFITPADNLLTIADLRTVWVLADLYESDIAGTHLGETAVMTVEAYPNRTFNGTVSFIYPTVSPESRTTKVRISFTNDQMALKPGMFAEVDLQMPEATALTIPREALMDNGDIAYVFVRTHETQFTPRKVKVGRTNNDFVEILSGVTEGETVVTSANFLIDSESRLKAAVAGMGAVTPTEHQEHGK